MKFATLFLLATQIGLSSLCVIQREYVLKRGELIVSKRGITGAACFAECLNNKKCTNLCYAESLYGQCHLFPDGDDEVILKPNASRKCYTLHREQEKPSLYTKILTFTRKGSIWVA